MDRFYRIVLALVILSITSTFAIASDFKILTEEYPPFNYTDNGKLTGVSTDIVVEIAKRLGNPTDITVEPWARAYQLIQKKDDIILFSMTRTDARESLFKWVGPVAPNKWVFFAKKGSGISINSLDDAKEVGKIGTYKDDAAETFLKTNGFGNIDSVLKDDQNVPKLMAGRINLWIVGELQGIHKAKKQHVADKLEMVFEVKDTQLYIAFNKNTPDAEIVKWQKALDDMKADGTYDALMKKYI